jgi:threonine/homoserine/homoserine lactone efflux protein
VSFEFWVTSLVIAVTPGTGVIFTLAAGLTRGARASLVAALGCTLGIVPHMAAAITGAAALLYASGVAFAVLKYAGVAYLLWMAWSTLRETGTLSMDRSDSPPSAWRTVTSAVLVNLLNPKLTIFFFAFLPQFVPADTANGIPMMLQLSAAFMLVTFVVFAAYGICASAVRDQVISRPRVLTWMRRTFAVSFLGLGARLAFTPQ